MSISVLARRHGVNGHTFRKQYKEVISGYRSWSQGSHAESYILYPENLGPDLSLDETSLSNGEVYTVLTNKSAHGRNGSLVAMVRGVATDTVSQVLMRLPHEKRSGVSTVTTDLSSAMMLTARRAFPRAMIVNDRFHVQQLMSEAVVRLRWQVLEEENRSMREHRERRKAAVSRAERDALGPWEPVRMANGETMPQVMARSRHVILKHESKWNAQQRERAAVLFGRFPVLGQAYRLSMRLTELFNKRSTQAQARLNLARWYNEVEAFGMEEFARVLETFENHNETIINYFVDRLTNASAESFNAKIKALRSQFRGVGDIRFFMFRLATLYA